MHPGLPSSYLRSPYAHRKLATAGLPVRTAWPTRGAWKDKSAMRFREPTWRGIDSGRSQPARKSWLDVNFSLVDC